MKFQSHFARHRRHETLVFFGILAAKLVIDVRDAGDPDSQLPQDMQQAHRIRPARHRDDHASARRQHVVTGNGRGYLLQHAPIMPLGGAGFSLRGALAPPNRVEG